MMTPTLRHLSEGGNVLTSEMVPANRNCEMELRAAAAGWVDRQRTSPSGASMDDPDRYKKYAEECKRLAKTMSLADRKVMLEIAEAWLICAKEAEKKAAGKQK
jgi:hypothetical protein